MARRQKSRVRRQAVLVFLMVLSAAAWPAFAADTYWQCDPNTPGDWFDPNHWTADVPGASDYAYVDNGGTTQIAAGTAAAYSLTLGYSSAGAAVQTGGAVEVGHTLSLANCALSSGAYGLEGGDLAVHRDLIVGESGDGQFTQSGGSCDAGTLWLGRGAAGTGTYELHGGQLTTDLTWLGHDPAHGLCSFDQSGGVHSTGRLYVGYHGLGNAEYLLSGTSELIVEEWTIVGDDQGGNSDANFVQTGGTHLVNERLYVLGKGTYSISAGALEAHLLLVWGVGGTAKLAIGGAAADVTVTRGLWFRHQGALSAAPGSAIHMVGASFQNESFANPSSPDGRMPGLANLNMIFEGGAAAVSYFEAAGKDLGADPAAWTNNFALGTLTLGGADVGRVRLGDAWGNNYDWDGEEALYVFDLVFNAGGLIDLNGFNLYYLNGGDPKQFFPGDVTLDGIVNAADLGVLGAHYRESGTDWSTGDLSGDGMTNVADLGILGAWYGSTTPPPPGGGQPVPEPATMAMLALCGAALLHRRGSMG